MRSVAPRKPERCAIVICECCGRVFSVSSRAERAIRSGHRSAKCSLCMYRVELVVDDHLRSFWLELYPASELREIAEAAWGPREKWSSDWRDGFTFLPSLLAAA